jgi:hypothetical protein
MVDDDEYEELMARKRKLPLSRFFERVLKEQDRCNH